MDRTCVSTGRSPETSGPSSPEAPTPTLATVAEATPARRGVLRARLLRPAGRHAMVVAHFFESGQRRRLRWGRVESAPLMAGAVALASTGYIAAIDEKAWAGPRRLGPGVQGSPQREPALPTETAREQSTRGARSSHPFGAGAGSQPVAPPGTGCSPANGTPEELRRLARPCVLSIALPLRFYYDLPKRPPKISGVLTHRRNTNILGRPATGRVTSRGFVPESAKRHPQFVR